MSDRRSRQPQRCAVRACPYLGHFLDGYCPSHRSEAAAARAVAQRAVLAAEMHATPNNPNRKDNR